MVKISSWAARADWLAHVGKAMWLNNHSELIPMLRPHIPEDGIVMDVGAHSGQTAKVFARLASRGRVYAFEPGSYALSVLRPGIWASRLSNIEIVPLALSDFPGSGVLHMPVKKHGGYGFGLSHLAASNDRPTIDDPITLSTLDLFVSERAIRRVDFIKVDIEGWEMHFLRGARDTLAKFRPAVMIEVIEDSLARSGSSAREVFDFLNSLGYTAINMSTGRTCVTHDGDPNYLFVQRGAEPLNRQG